MHPISLPNLTHNAYRTLGLTAQATMAEVDCAARSMRLWEDSSQIPPSRCDAAFLGPVKRMQQDIEAAVSRLSDPESRVEERLWWFCSTPPADDSPIAVLTQSPATARHDAALISLYRALLTAADDGSRARWQALIARFQQLSADEDYLDWLLKTESAGDFEKRASAQEIAEAQRHMAQRVRGALAEAAGRATGQDPASSAASAVELLRAAGPASPGNAAAVDPAAGILDSLEDRLIEHCNSKRDSIANAWKTGKINILRPACHRVVNQIDSAIRPLVRELAAGDGARKDRARQQAAGLVAYAAEAYEACYDFVSAERALTIACDFAAETFLEPALRSRLANAVMAAHRQRLGVPPKQRQNSAFPLPGASGATVDPSSARSSG